VEEAAVTYAPPPVPSWCREAAGALERQLNGRRARAHSALLVPLARAIGLPRPATVGVVLDLLQTAIDLADNLADVEEDRAAGRPPAYTTAPREALVCLPSLLVGMAMSRLASAYGEASFRSSYATRRVLGVLATMVVGQALPKSHRRHDELVSGHQGLLLCLPFWLVSKRDPTWRRRLPRIERWAMAFGRTWEARERHGASPTRATSAAYRASVVAAHRSWPTFAPFRRGDAGAPDALLAGGIS
jgi:hypothetical protein